MTFAHAGAPGGVEIEILLLGLAFFAAAFAFRPAAGGDVKTVVITGIIGTALVVASVVL